MKFNFVNLPDELSRPFAEIKPHLQFDVCQSGMAVTVQKNNIGPKMIVENNQIVIEYHKIPEFFRMLTMLPNRSETDGIYEEFPAHEDLCLMADCSRNAVFNIDGAKKMIRFLALMGFTSFMLYTEDTYEVPEYPFFGYIRGRFSQEELQEIDAYALQFGIEMIPCMQVLAHLEATLRWTAFKEIVDTGNILLVGEEKTYEFIEAMIRSCRKCFHTNRIHIGMDEAHLIGSGKYLEKNGYRDRSEIILEHLERVVEICKKYDFKPMMWSDMFFRIKFGKYYVDEGEISKEVIDLVPKEVALVYWDYYTLDEKLFRHMIKCHKQFNNSLAFAGGAWKWRSMSPSNYHSILRNDLHLAVSKEEKIPLVIATAWGDNGGEASHFSIMPTLQQYAEYCYAKGEDRAWLSKRFKETYGISFEDFMLLDTPNLLSDTDLTVQNNRYAKHFLYNDSLGGWLDYNIKEQYSDEFAQKAEALSKVPANEFSYLFKASEMLCCALALKATLSFDIRNAYHSGDKTSLNEIATKRIPTTIAAVDQYIKAAREEWYIDNKTFGFDVIELRLGGLKERLNSTKLRLESYTNGDIDKIEQLEEPLLSASTRATWSKISSGCVNN